MSETGIKKKSSGLSLKHKIGYGLGDAGGCMTFAIMGSTFSMYCTDALGIDTRLLAILLAIWNVWDFDPIGYTKTKLGENRKICKFATKSTGAVT